MTFSVSLDRWLDRLTGFLWGITLLTLPVTSFPYFPFFGPETQVRPLSLYPMFLLLPILAIRIWRRKITLWDESLSPFIVFILITLLTSAVGALYAPLDLRGQQYWGRVGRAWLTMAIGLAFLLYAMWLIRSPQQLRSSLKWLYVGLGVTFFWDVLLFLSVTTPWIDRSVISRLQDNFTIATSSDWGLRTPGFSLEPSWLAGQLATLYLPWLFASLMSGYRVSRYRWLEIVLFGMACISLLLTYSRGGIALALVAALMTAILTGRQQLLLIWRWWMEPFRHTRSQGHPWRSAAIRVSVLFLLCSTLAASLFLLSRSNYFAQLWLSKKTDLIGYIVDIYAGPRLAYSWAALKTFAAHPLSGVGLGASGLYLLHFLPDWSRTLIPETTLLLAPQSVAFLNPKNLYARLLAETGIFGFTAFVIFYLYVLGKIHAFLRNKEQRFLGMAGLFTWLALVLYCFTQDSFAMPNMWINLGILLGLAGAYKTAAEEPALGLHSA